MSTLTADNPQEQQIFNSLADKLKGIQIETAAIPEGEDAAKTVEKLAEPPPKREPDAPKPEPAKDAPKPEPEAGESTKGMSPKKAAEWEAVKKSRDEFKSKAQQLEEAKTKADQQLVELNKQIEQLKQSMAPVEEVENLKKERDQFKEVVKMRYLEDDPQFNQEFEAKVKEQMDLAGAIVGPALAVKAAKILQMPDGQERNEKLEELKGELTEDQQLDLRDVRRNLRLVQLDRTNKIQEARKNFATFQKQREDEHNKQIQTAQQTFKAVGQKLSDPKEGWSVFQKGDNHEWNQGVEQRLAEAESLFTGKQPVEKVAEAAYRAAAFPAVLQLAKRLMDQLNQKESQIAEMAKASPPATDAGKAPQVVVGRPQNITGDMNPQEAMSKWIQDAQRIMRGE